jgi:hypothetical protein
MPLKPFHKIPDDLREWGEWCRNTTVEPGDATVTESMLVDNAATNRVLRDSQAYSVIGNPTASAANPSDIAAGADGVFLGRRAGAVQFVAIQDSDIPSTLARDSEVTAAIAAHEGASDPHPTYSTAAELSSAISTHEGLADPHAVYRLFRARGHSATQRHALTSRPARLLLLRVVPVHCLLRLRATSP